MKDQNTTQKECGCREYSNVNFNVLGGGTATFNFIFQQKTYSYIKIHFKQKVNYLILFQNQIK